MSIQILFVFLVLAVTTLNTNGQEIKPENFSFFKLWITNNNNEVLLVKWHGNWEIPGTKYDDTLSLAKFLDKMAVEMGVKKFKPSPGRFVYTKKNGRSPFCFTALL